MAVNEVNWMTEEISDEHTLTWSRKDYGTSRLMLPGPEGPLWSSCTRRLAQDLDTGMIIEDRPVSEVTGRERRREFRGGGRNIETTFTCQVTRDVQPHQWECDSRGHCGWLRVPGTCEACGDVGKVRPVKRASICVVHREADGKAYVCLG